MSQLRLIAASLIHYLRMHIAVALGVMAATAVLTGALVVGDSVRGSLRSLTLDRLGRIDEVLVGDQFFRAKLAEELADQKQFANDFSTAVPAILLEGTLERPTEQGPVRASQITVIGGDASFWKLNEAPTPQLPGEDEVLLNSTLATELGAKVGDELLLRIPLQSDIPSESPLGKKTDLVPGRRLRVAAIIPTAGLGNFGLRPTQQMPRNAYLSLGTLQDMLDQPDRANAIFVAGKDGTASTETSSAALQQMLRPRAEDFGLTIKQIRIGSDTDPVNDYIDISSQRMILPPAIVKRAMEEFTADGIQPAISYLVNTIQLGDKQVPYSVATGINIERPIGPYTLAEGTPLADDEIVLNDWTARELGTEVGDTIALTYYEPESTHGELRHPAPVPFKLRAIVPLAAPGEPPTQANDPHLTPELRGVTDQKSISNWDLPFALVETIRKQDEDYWDDYRTTPKVFLTLAAARKLWTSRFGDTTSLRIPASDGMTVAAVENRLKLDPARFGLEFLPIKRLSLAASSGTTPFDVLFLAFSMFIIASAVMLVALLFRLGVEERAREVGIELATGIPMRQIRRMLAAEGFVVAAIGALVGVAAGVGYAALMLAGLRTWWLAAIFTPFLHLHVTGRSLVIGYAVGVIVSLLTILWTLRRMRGISVRRLLAGQATDDVDHAFGTSRLGRRLAIGMLIAAVLLALAATQLGGEAQAGAFFGCGALVLAAALTGIRAHFRTAGSGGERLAGFSLLGLAARNGQRNPGRSALTIGLVAAASFLIVAVSAFRLGTTDEGTGGFALLARSDQPLVHDLNTPTGRAELAFSKSEEKLLADCRIYSLRVRSGDDASCLNLYQARQPRVLGIPHSLVERGGFAFAESTAESEAERNNPWLLLEKPLASGAVPTILDKNTAMYSLHLYNVGSIYEIDDGRGGRIKLEVVALLASSMLQGDLLVSEANFLKLFPQVSGYRAFLVAVPTQGEGDAATAGDATIASVQQALEQRLGDYGFYAERARDRLAGLLAVQNTYLSTFQSLGALGLLFGTFGLATVQLRNVLERRGELALMRAAGFRRGKLGRLVMIENSLLLLGGLATGVVAALVAILPHLLLGGARIPWQSLATMLSLIVLVGLAAGFAAVRAVLRAPLLAALRGD